MSNLLLLMLCFALGMGARRYRSLPKDGFKVLNAWVIFVSLPALVLSAVHAVELRAELFIGAGCLWLVFLGAAGLSVLTVKKGLLTPAVAGALALSAGLGNTAFFGFPMLETLGGQEVLPAATVIDQLGTFGALSLFAVPFAISTGGGHLHPRLLVMRVLSFPPFIALVLALASRSIAYPAPLESVLERLAAMMSPLALASVGWQLDLSALKGHGVRLTQGLAFKLVLAPAVIFALLLTFHHHLGLTERVTIAQAAMPPMVTSAVLAGDHHLDAPLASSLVAVGLFVSVVSVPLWWLLTGVFS